MLFKSVGNGDVEVTVNSDSDRAFFAKHFGEGAVSVVVPGPNFAAFAAAAFAQPEPKNMAKEGK
jgi:hypothetical protein